jgi:iron-sulfur cluster assembly accessory protein
MLQVTEKARQKVAEIITAENKTGHGLRVQVMGGGCSGFQYGLTFADAAGPADTVIDCGPFKVFIDPVSSQYLDKATVDYIDGLNGSGFKIENPEAKSTCGCGSSFSA